MNDCPNESNTYSLPTIIYGGFPGGSEVKASAWNAGDVGKIPGSGRSSAEGNGNPLQYSCLGKSHGRRSLVGYSPWVRKESDTTERLHLHLHLHLLRHLGRWHYKSFQLFMWGRYYPALYSSFIFHLFLLVLKYT